MTNHIIIIGGTSGLGLALANAHLAQNWHVTIVGSNSDKIAKLHKIYANQPKVTMYQCDITDIQQRNGLFTTLEKTPFNRLIYCAGKYYNERKQTLSQTESQQMLAVNLQAFQGVFAWASGQLQVSNHPQKHLIAIASVAGLLDFGEASLYAKCKRAMIVSCEAYRMGLEPFGVGVTCIASGYINTEQLRALNGGNASHKPHLISETEAVSEILHAIDHNLPLHIFPKAMHRTIAMLTLLPKPILTKIMRLQYRLQDKQVKQDPK